MANRLYNKQVSPKGYQKGGSVKKSEHPLAGREGNVKHRLKSQKELKKITDSDAYKKANYKGKTEMLGGKVLKKMGGRIGKMGGGMMKRPMMKKGGALKPVDPKTQKGLSKLPTEVRNKMGYMKDGGKVKNKKSIIQSIIDIPKTIRSNQDAIKKIGKKMDEEKRFKDKMSKAKSKAFSESLKQPRKRERLDDKIKENAKKVAMMRATGQI